MADAAPTLHSAWSPYAVLPPSQRRTLSAPTPAPVLSYLSLLSIPAPVAAERIAGKYLQLDQGDPGKTTERRKKELRTRELERTKKRECGLVGRRKRMARKGDKGEKVRYESVLPMHTLWLSYISELLSLPLLLPSASLPPHPNPIQSTSELLPTYPPRSTTASQAHETESFANDLKISVPGLHAKLVKAEYVGCLMTVKRAKNPSLVNLVGLVLQETQGTFKIVTSKSQIKILPKKGSIFNFALPLNPPPPLSTSAAKRNPEMGSAKRELTFDIYGDAFCYRSAERVGKKWKAGNTNGGVSLV